MLAKRMMRQERAADPLPLRRAQKVMVRVAADVAPSISRGVQLHSAIRHCSLLARSSDDCTAAMKALATGATEIAPVFVGDEVSSMRESLRWGALR